MAMAVLRLCEQGVGGIPECLAASEGHSKSLLPTLYPSMFNTRLTIKLDPRFC